MITKAETRPTIDADALADEICEEVCKAVEVGEGIVATRGRMTPDGPVTRDVAGPVLKTTEVEVEIPIWEGGDTSIEGGVGIRPHNMTLRIEGSSVIANYQIAVID